MHPANIPLVPLGVTEHASVIDMPARYVIYVDLESIETVPRMHYDASCFQTWSLNVLRNVAPE